MYVLSRSLKNGLPSCTYSWRTVSGSKYSPRPMEDLNSGSPLERLAKRQRYLNEMDASMSALAPFGGRYARTDAGHDFTVVKMQGAPARARFVNFLGQEVYNFSGLPGSFETFASAALPFPSSWSPALAPFSEWRRYMDPGRVRGWMSSILPQNTGVGETIIELVRGDLPAALVNVKRLANADVRRYSVGDKVVKVSRSTALGRFLESSARASGKSTKPNSSLSAPAWLAASGKDYLGVHFGLIPTLSAFAQTLGLLAKVTETLYGSSFRRKSQFLMDDFSHVVTRSAPLSRYEEIKGRLNVTTMTPYNGGIPYAESTYHANARLSLRASLSGQAPPVITQYYTEPENWLRDIGLWTPSLGWDVLPWSWLLDWGAHLGAGIERASFFRVYPVDYAYVTYKSTVATTISSSRYKDTNGVYTISGSSSSTTTLHRRRINPFGTPEALTSLSAAQMSVLVALGLAAVK